MIPVLDSGGEFLDFAYSALQVDAEWSVRSDRSFSWWPYDLKQTVAVDAPRSVLGVDVCKVTITTQVLQDVAASGRLFEILTMTNRLACGSSLVHDEDLRRVDLHACLYVNPENLAWTAQLGGFVAATQAAEAHMVANPLQEALSPISMGRRASSRHPVAGLRPRPDDMLRVIETVYSPLGQRPTPFGTLDFEAATGPDSQDPSLLTNFDMDGLTAEFSFQGKESVVQRMIDRLSGRRGRALGSALFRAELKPHHPQYGSGCLTLLTLPTSDEDNLLVNRLNLAERDDWTRTQGFGAWCMDAKGITHAAFLPAGIYSRGLFKMIYWNACARAAWAGRFLA